MSELRPVPYLRLWVYFGDDVSHEWHGKADVLSINAVAMADERPDPYAEEMPEAPPAGLLNVWIGGLNNGKEERLSPARRLALAVLAGDDGAALALADLVSESVNGDRTTATGKLIAEAVRKEREEIIAVMEQNGRDAGEADMVESVETFAFVAEWIRGRNTP